MKDKWARITGGSVRIAAWNTDSKKTGGLTIFTKKWYYYMHYLDLSFLSFLALNCLQNKVFLRISLVNVNKSAVAFGFVHNYWRNP